MKRIAAIVTLVLAGSAASAQSEAQLLQIAQRSGACGTATPVGSIVDPTGAIRVTCRRAVGNGNGTGTGIGAGGAAAAGGLLFVAVIAAAGGSSSSSSSD